MYIYLFIYAVELNNLNQHESPQSLEGYQVETLPLVMLGLLDIVRFAHSSNTFAKTHPPDMFKVVSFS